MMTTLAALLGAVPLALAFGTGAELRRPLGIAIIGGLIVSQMLTLYTTPVVYLALERLAGRRPPIVVPANHADVATRHARGLTRKSRPGRGPDQTGIGLPPHDQSQRSASRRSRSPPR